MRLLDALRWRANGAVWTGCHLLWKIGGGRSWRTVTPEALPDNPRILLIPRPALGNLILFTPVIRNLKRHWPESSIELVLPPGQLSDLMRQDPDLAKVSELALSAHSLMGVRRAARTVGRGSFDLCLTVFNPSGALLAFWAGVKLRLGPLHNCGWTKDSGGLLHLARKADPALHEVKQYLRLLEFLNVPVRDSRTYVPVTEKDGALVEGLLADIDRGVRRLVAIHPGAGSDLPEKRWPPERFAAAARYLANRGDSIPVLIGGPEERGLAKGILRLVSESDCLDLTGRLSIAQTAAFLKRCDLLVSNDSGPCHLAAAVGTPVVAIFGPTVPDKNHPWMPESEYEVVRLDLPCSPCYEPYSSRVRCTNPVHLQCLEGIGPDLVIGSIDRRLRASSR